MPFVRSFHEVDALAHFCFHEYNRWTSRSAVDFAFAIALRSASKSWPSQVNTCQLNAAHLPAKSPKFITSSVEPSICWPLQSTKLIKLSTPWCGAYIAASQICPSCNSPSPCNEKTQVYSPLSLLHLCCSDRRAQSLAQRPRGHANPGQSFFRCWMALQPRVQLAERSEFVHGEIPTAAQYGIPHQADVSVGQKNRSSSVPFMSN